MGMAVKKSAMCDKIIVDRKPGFGITNTLHVQQEPFQRSPESFQATKRETPNSADISKAIPQGWNPVAEVR